MIILGHTNHVTVLGQELHKEDLPLVFQFGGLMATVSDTLRGWLLALSLIVSVSHIHPCGS